MLAVEKPLLSISSVSWQRQRGLRAKVFGISAKAKLYRSSLGTTFNPSGLGVSLKNISTLAVKRGEEPIFGNHNLVLNLYLPCRLEENGSTNTDNPHAVQRHTSNGGVV
ncbi:uncharacterized protein QC761_0015540 [Podospora bellae-mahoneyi]|uniref:Uncharacterized protein n=1 Tax=Podospora bellae-mahoneyi TaxID=2093777 RepID=A0ABR0FZG9_9PEZI|nr:hypothetical protein QC761_0015540 [Podospora bellae-mahoneyi]